MRRTLLETLAVLVAIGLGIALGITYDGRTMSMTTYLVIVFAVCAVLLFVGIRVEDHFDRKNATSRARNAARSSDPAGGRDHGRA